jgi:hypothetical protein
VSLDFDNFVAVWQKSLHWSRPVTNISFALNYFFGQYNVTGYHLVNIAIHCIAGIFLFLLVGTTINLPALRVKGYSTRWLPFLAALIWLINPVQTQSVTYVVQRMNSMTAMFYVMALFAYVQGRLADRWRLKLGYFGGAAGAGLLALGSKEIAVTLPVFIVLYEWYFLQDLQWGWLKKHGWLLGGLFGLLLSGAVFFFYGKDPLSRLLAEYAFRDFTLGERLLTEARVVIFYLTLLLLPVPGRLNLDHDFPLSHSLLEPVSTLLSLTALVLFAGLAVVLARRHRLLSFGIIWFLGNLAIESSFVPLEIIFEHRLYLPSMMLIPALLASARKYLTGRYPKMITVTALVLILMFWTYQRNQAWADPIWFWSDCVQKSPDKARVHNNLAMILHETGLYPEKTEYHLREAIRVDRSFGEAYCNLANIRWDQGRFAEAIELYTKALEIHPNVALWHFNLGDTLVQVWRLQEAREQFAIALQLDPGLAEAKAGLSRVNLMIARSNKKTD